MVNRRTFTDEEVNARAVKRAALVLFELWEEGRGTHSRLLEMLVPDSYVTVGVSHNGGEWREHLVPLSRIRDECHRLFEEGLGVESAASFIERHMKVAYITRDERERLDFELGLKSKMPEGWTPGDYMARLAAAGINLDERKTF